jgi:hypothetical protein
LEGRALFDSEDNDSLEKETNPTDSPWNSSTETTDVRKYNQRMWTPEVGTEPPNGMLRFFKFSLSPCLFFVFHLFLFHVLLFFVRAARQDVAGNDCFEQ